MWTTIQRWYGGSRFIDYVYSRYWLQCLSLYLIYKWINLSWSSLSKFVSFFFLLLLLSFFFFPSCLMIFQKQDTNKTEWCTGDLSYLCCDLSIQLIRSSNQRFSFNIVWLGNFVFSVPPLSLSRRSIVAHNHLLS